MKKVISVHSGFVPEGTLKYEGQYIFKCVAVREGKGGLGPGFPQPDLIEDLDLSGVAGIEGKMERQIPVNKSHPLNARIHKYYLLEQDVWICNRGNLRFVSDWTPQEVWALACEDTLDDDGKLVDRRDLGFFIIHSDRKNGIIV